MGKDKKALSAGQNKIVNYLIPKSYKQNTTTTNNHNVYSILKLTLSLFSSRQSSELAFKSESNTNNKHELKSPGRCFFAQICSLLLRERV